MHGLWEWPEGDEYARGRLSRKELRARQVAGNVPLTKRSRQKGNPFSFFHTKEPEKRSGQNIDDSTWSGRRCCGNFRGQLRAVYITLSS
jgi:hypothetical protein